MATPLSIVALLAVVLLHAVVTALLTRFFRVRLSTRVGSALYTLLIVPLVLTVSTIVTTGALKIGPDLGSRNTALFVTIVVPFVLGVAYDYVWMPAPEEVSLPEATE